MQLSQNRHAVDIAAPLGRRPKLGPELANQVDFIGVLLRVQQNARDLLFLRRILDLAPVLVEFLENVSQRGVASRPFDYPSFAVWTTAPIHRL